MAKIKAYSLINKSDIGDNDVFLIETDNGTKTVKVKDVMPTKTSDLTNDSGFLISHQDISGKENTSNKVTTISASSTNKQYASALAVKNYVDAAIGGVENGAY